MEQLGKATAIRLQNHNGAYMVARDDKATVGESGDGSSPNARWLVERVEGKPNVIRLKSCFGLYLTATDGKVDWQPIPDGDGVKLKSRGDKLLQEPKSQNWAVHLMRWVGELLHSCCEPSHHEPNSGATLNWVFWHVEAVPLNPGEVALPGLQHIPFDWQPISSDMSDTNSSSSYLWLQHKYVLTEV